jgi:hypothetical protein
MICLQCQEECAPNDFFVGSHVCKDCTAHAAQPVVLTIEQIRELASDTVRQTLTMLGLDVSDPLEAQRDFAALRDWRLAMAGVRRKSTLVLTGILVSGMVAAILMGVREYVRGLLPTH